MVIKKLLWSLIALASIFCSIGQSQDEMDYVHPKSPNEPSPFVPAKDALKTFKVQEGFRLELIASDPMIHDPVAIDFDEFGRIWVAEMRSYMTDVNDSGFKKAMGRIMLLEDENRDGVMDKATEFLTNLPRPRAIRCVNGGILYADTSKLWFVPEKNRKAGTPQLIDKQFTRGGNVEHQPNALYPAFNNWYYVSNSIGKKYGLRNGKWVIASGAGRGQWGLSQDDGGRFVWNTNSNKVNVDSLPIEYYREPLTSSGIQRSFGVSGRVFPIRPNTGINRGYRLLKNSKDGFFRDVTASCGPCVYRGNQFPPEFYGNYFSCAPCTNTVPRTIPTNDGTSVRLQGAPSPAGHEFVASTDERSRMVNLYSGPDGTLYLVDFYRGVFQDKGYLTDYLKKEIARRKLESPIGGGRIYRLVYEKNPLTNWDRLGELSTREVVAFLEHPNYWHRRTAQRMLVQGDGKNVIDAIRKIARTSKAPQGRIHALWTLAGLDQLDLDDLQAATSLENDDLLTHVIRLTETISSNDVTGLHKLFGHLRSLNNPRVDLQLALSLPVLSKNESDKSLDILQEIIKANGKDRLVISAAIYSATDDQAYALWRDALKTNDPIATMILGRLAHAKKVSLDQVIKEIASQENMPATFRQSLLKTAGKSAVQTRNSKAVLGVLDLLRTASTRDINATMKEMLSGRGRGYRKMDIANTPPVLQELVVRKEKSIQENARRIEKEVFRVTSNTPKIDLSYRKSKEYQRAFAAGRKHYVAHCMSCHQLDGLGAEKLGPPLASSQWLENDPKVAIRIILNGIAGPIDVDGTIYQPPEILPLMPGLSSNAALTDEVIADLLTYVRNEWGNTASPVSAETVRSVRSLSAKEMAPYDVAKLNDFRLGRTADLSKGNSNPKFANLVGSLPYEKVLATVLASPGDIKLGETLFTKQTCITCHVTDPKQAPVAPKLHGISTRAKRDEIVESILKPSAKITEGYATNVIITDEGKVYAGFVIREDAKEVVLRTPQGQTQTIAKDSIDERTQTKVSSMPEGVVSTLTVPELAALIAYVESLPKQD